MKLHKKRSVRFTFVSAVSFFKITFQDEMLSAALGPGLPGQVYDGLQNPLPQLAEKSGYFLKPGTWVATLDSERLWEWISAVEPGDIFFAG